MTCTIANCSRLFCLYTCPCAPRCNVSWLCFRCFAVHVRCMSGNRHGYVWASPLPTLHEMHPKQKKKHHCFLVNPRPADPGVVSFEEVRREQAHPLVFRLLSATERVVWTDCFARRLAVQSSRSEVGEGRETARFMRSLEPGGSACCGRRWAPGRQGQAGALATRLMHRGSFANVLHPWCRSSSGIVAFSYAFLSLASHSVTSRRLVT